jgi:DNA ligase-1
VSQQLVFKALARTFDIDEKVVAHKLMGSWLPQQTDLKTILLSTGNSSDHSQPYPFYLAYQLDVPFSSMGDISEWQIERKYDGIRGQVIVRANEVHVWSRGEELMTEKFVEFSSLNKLIPDGTVIDGEVLPFKDGKILSFNEMQKRTGRKNISKKILNDVPLCLMCYDLLEYGGKDIREKPLKERRALLEQLLRESQADVLKLSPLLEAPSWEVLDTLRNESRLLGCEGLMLKQKESVYETGRRRGNWWKWKVDPYSVDAVLIYAQSGHGRRANLFTDYTFAVWDKGELVPFAKAYSGLTDKEIVEVDSWIKKNTIEKFGPVRSVKAELVFEKASIFHQGTKAGSLCAFREFSAGAKTKQKKRSIQKTTCCSYWKLFKDR